MAPLGEESVEISDFETQFIPRPDDLETLWEVIEITGENAKKKLYKVKWAGTDPTSGKHWPQSWVPKRDCTDDIVEAWKLKRAKRRAEGQSSRRSTTSRTSKVSTASHSTAKKSSVRSSTGGSTRSALDATAVPRSSSSKPRPTLSETTKRKRSPSPIGASHLEPSSSEESDSRLLPSRKKRKVASLQETGKSSRSTLGTEQPKKSSIAPPRYEKEEEEEETDYDFLPPVRPKGKGRAKSPDIFDAIDTDTDSEPGAAITKVGPPRSVTKPHSKNGVSRKKPTSFLGIKGKHKVDAEVLSVSSDSDGAAEVVYVSRAKGSAGKNAKNPSRSKSKRFERARGNQPTAQSTRTEAKQTNIVNHSKSTSPSLVSPDAGPLLSSGAEIRLNRFDADANNLVLVDDQIPHQPSSPQDQDYASDLEVPDAVPRLSQSPTRPQPQITTRGAVHRSLDDSIVPETETQSSTNSQPVTSLLPPPPNPPQDSQPSDAAPPSMPTVPPTPTSLPNIQPSIADAPKQSGSKPLRPVPVISPSVFRRHLLLPTDDDPPPSSIETFSSPEKGKSTDKRRKRDESSDADAALRARGEHLAKQEQCKRERQREREKLGKAPRRPLDSVMADLQTKLRDWKPQAGKRQLPRFGENVPTLPGAERQISRSKNDKKEEKAALPRGELMQEMEETYLDLNGGAGHDSGDAISSELPEQEIQDSGLPTESEKLPRANGTEPSQVDLIDGTDGEDAVTGSPAPSHDHKTTSHFESRLSEATSLIEANAKEISRLQSLLVAQQAMCSSLTQDVPRLTETNLQLKQESTAKSEANTELQQKLTESENRFTQGSAAWGTERDTLTSSINELNRSKKSADDTVELFREKYYEASAFVSTVQKENTELKTRVSVAEDQAKQGIASIRKLFEARMQTLEGELDRWKGQTELLRQMDKRTGGEDIRKRAAEAPELRVLNSKLQQEVEGLNATTEELLEQIETLNCDKMILERERDVWINEMSHETHSTGGSQEMVYRCRWLPEGSFEPCQEVFVDLEELKLHSKTHILGST